MTEKKDTFIIGRQQLDTLFALLAETHTMAGPTLKNNVVVYDEVSSLSEMPLGLVEKQEAGSYRLQEEKSPLLFSFHPGPQTWKKFLYPPVQTLWTARKTDSGFTIHEPEKEQRKFALFGLRPCEARAISIQDRVFINETFTEPTYAHNRQRVFTVVVNCHSPAATCFCTSVGSGPHLQGATAHDLLLTEVQAGPDNSFLLSAGSPAGEAMLAKLKARPAANEDLQKKTEQEKNASSQISRQLPGQNLAELLAANRENPYWQELGARCLSCASCTMVCPTCFCATVEDITSLDGQSAERQRRMDSCFTLDFTVMHGKSMRAGSGMRYRQWLTHKLGAWHEQFGEAGCVGCGRCITWCPVGIDLTAETRLLAEKDMRNHAGGSY